MAEGWLEWGCRYGVGGWWRAGAAPARLELFADGHCLAAFRADRPRADLAALGPCGFEAWVAPLPPERAVTLSVRTPDGRDIPGSPLRLEPPPPPGAAVASPEGSVVLAIDAAAPDPARDAGSAALAAHLRALAALGLTPRFVPLDAAAAEIVAAGPRLRLAWLHRLRAAALIPLIRAHAPQARAIWSVADLAHLREARRAEIEGGAPPLGLRAAEFDAARRADAVVAHSAVECALLERVIPGLRAHAVPWDVPRHPPPPFAERAGIGFLGQYGHAPNLDAAMLLLGRVMPLVWRERPIPLLLGGRGMPDWLADAARAAGGPVRLLPDLPDAATLWHAVRVSTAPLRYGAGIKGKVLDSLAHGVPAVCSPLAAEGLTLPPMSLADGPAAMATRLREWHDHEGLNALALALSVPALSDPDTVRRALGWAVA